jgi:hypothetical protein
VLAPKLCAAEHAAQRLGHGPVDRSGAIAIAAPLGDEPGDEIAVDGRERCRLAYSPCQPFERAQGARAAAVVLPRLVPVAGGGDAPRQRGAA